jgi:hypothetical protein
MVLQHASVIVAHGQSVTSRNEVRVVYSRVIKVMNSCSYDRGESVYGLHANRRVASHEEAVEGNHDICSMITVMVWQGMVAGLDSIGVGSQLIHGDATRLIEPQPG